MFSVDNSMFGGAENTAHFERDGISIDLPERSFWDCVKGICAIVSDSPESALVAEAVECTSAMMPVGWDKCYDIDQNNKQTISQFMILAEPMLRNFHTCMIDNLLVFRVPIKGIYFAAACLRSKLMIAVAKGKGKSIIIYANSNDYMFMFDSIREFNKEMFCYDGVDG